MFRPQPGSKNAQLGFLIVEWGRREGVGNVCVCVGGGVHVSVVRVRWVYVEVEANVQFVRKAKSLTCKVLAATILSITSRVFASAVLWAVIA